MKFIFIILASFMLVKPNIADAMACNELVNDKIEQTAVKSINIEHIYHGEYTISAEGNKLITGGLHSHEKMSEFLIERDDIEVVKVEELENGVTRVSLPREAFNRKSWLKSKAIIDGNIKIQGSKSIFPKEWDQDKVIKAIYKVVDENFVDRDNMRTQTIIGEYEGVIVKVILTNKKVDTAFPLFQLNIQ